MARSSKRSPCPVSCTLDLIGDRWTLLIVRDLFAGKSLFKEFSASPEKIASNVLSDRLHRLCEAGVIERVPHPSGRDAYALTVRGRTLEPVLTALARWGLDHIKGTRAYMLPVPRA